jgi:hypothetical protein
LRQDQDGFYKFAIDSLRGARRSGPNGNLVNQIILSISQKREIEHNGEVIKFRGGCTLILNLEDLRLRYVISKPIADDKRLERHREYRLISPGQSLRATYFGSGKNAKNMEPFALLHRSI